MHRFEKLTPDIAEGSAGGSSAEEAPRTPEAAVEKELRKKLQDVLDTPLNPENIGSYSEHALTELTELVDRTVASYKAETDSTITDQRVLEDTACSYYHLTDIQTVLGSLKDVADQIHRVKSFLAHQNKSAGVVFVPPDSRLGGVKRGDGAYESPKHNDRTLTLLYILEHEFTLHLDNDVQVSVGEVTGSMMRTTPYTKVSIPTLNRLVYVCDEEGNATYIFNAAAAAPLQVDLDTATKEQLNELVEAHPNIGARVVYGRRWRNELTHFLDSDSFTLDGEIDDTERGELDTILETKRENIPQVELTGIDKGCWTNPENKRRYAPISFIADLHGVSPRIINEMYSQFNKTGHEDQYAAVRIRNLQGRVFDGYPLDIFELPFSEKEQLPRPNGTGEFEGFYVDPKTNEPYAYVELLLQYLNKTVKNISSPSISRCIEEHKIAGIDTYDGRNERTMYPLNEIKKFLSILTIPKAETSGVNEGYYVAPDGIRYSPVNRIYKNFGIEGQRKPTIFFRTIPKLTIRDSGGRETDGYSVDAFKAALDKYPELDTEGKVTIDGVEYVSKEYLVKKSGFPLSDTRLEYTATEARKNKSTEIVRLFKKSEADAFIKEFVETKKLPQVNADDIYIAEGSTYSVESTLIRRYGLDRETFRRRMAKSGITVRQMELRDRKGSRRTGYCLEDLDKVFAYEQ